VDEIRFDRSTPSAQCNEGNTHMSTMSTLRQARVFTFALMLFLASTLFGTSAAVADVLNPKVDMGAPGGGGGSAVVVEDTASRGALSAF
jgi:hypothetical protein